MSRSHTAATAALLVFVSQLGKMRLTPDDPHYETNKYEISRAEFTDNAPHFPLLRRFGDGDMVRGRVIVRLPVPEHKTEDTAQ